MSKRYGKQAAFYVVYIREAHPTDGRQVRSNLRDQIFFEQPTTFDSRTEVAKMMCTKLKISIPCIIDGIDNKVGKAYAAAPDRLYVVGVDGKIVFKGGRGPRGFKPKEVATALDEYLPSLKSATSE